MMLKSGIAKENKKIKGLRKNDKSQNRWYCKREREREPYFTNIECGFVKRGNKSNLIETQEGRNTFIGCIKKTDYK